MCERGSKPVTPRSQVSKPELLVKGGVGGVAQDSIKQKSQHIPPGCRQKTRLRLSRFTGAHLELASQYGKVESTLPHLTITDLTQSLVALEKRKCRAERTFFQCSGSQGFSTTRFSSITATLASSLARSSTLSWPPTKGEQSR